MESDDNSDIDHEFDSEIEDATIKHPMLEHFDAKDRNCFYKCLDVFSFNKIASCFTKKSILGNSTAEVPQNKGD